MNGYDLAVVGLGAVGSATLMQAASRGLRCIGIDRYAPPHPLGSSHGETRITRQAIGEGLAYVPLVQRSHAIWRDLAAQTGEQLLVPSGFLMLSQGRRPDDGDGFLDRTLAAARRFGIDHSRLDAAAVRERYPQFAVADDDRAYFEPGGGYLRVERCIETNLAVARQRGAACRLDSIAAALHDARDHVAIRLADGSTIRAGEVVVAAGSWAGPLLGAPFDTLLTPTRQIMHWFDVDAACARDWQDSPAFIWTHRDRSEDFYGFPSIDNGRSIKLADERPPVATSPATIDRAVSATERETMYRSHVLPRLRGLTRGAPRAVTCLYTQTPDGHFLIDRHPQMPRVHVASPCSGHGFKHAAAIGEALAQRVAGGTSDLDLSPFRLDRFATYGSAR